MFPLSLPCLTPPLLELTESDHRRLLLISFDIQTFFCALFKFNFQLIHLSCQSSWCRVSLTEITAGRCKLVMPSVCGVVTLNVTCLDFILHSIKKQTVFVGRFVTESSVKLDSQQFLSDMFNLQPFTSLSLVLWSFS